MWRYPFDPCGGDYVLGEPQLEEISIEVGKGKTFRILGGENVLTGLTGLTGLSGGTPPAPKNPVNLVNPVQKTILNGKPVDGAVIRHDDVMKGGTLAFVGGKVEDFEATSDRKALAFTAHL